MKLATILNSTKTIVQVPVKDTLQLADNQLVNKNYQYLRRKPNPEYLKGLIICPLRTCLIHNNSDRNFWLIKKKSPLLNNQLTVYHFILNRMKDWNF